MRNDARPRFRFRPDRSARPDRPRTTAAWALARCRRPLGAVCAALALTGAVLLLRPPPAPADEVLVAARALNALSPLAPGDLAARRLPPEAVPEGALRPGDDPVGRSLTGPVTRGEVITRARIARPPARGYGPDLVAAPVLVPEPAPVELLRPGSRVDVLAAARASDIGGLSSAGQPARTVVTDRPVIAVPDPGGAAAGAAGGRLIVLAVHPDEARALAGHAASARLSVAIRGSPSRAHPCGASYSQCQGSNGLE